MIAPPDSAGPAFILNGHSVHVEEAKARIARISDGFGVAPQVILTKRGDDISSIAAQAVIEKRHPVVAGGGDGTVNAVAGRLAGTDTALGVLPIGTFNHFARDVGIPRNLEAAVRNIYIGQMIDIDVAEVNGRVFVNNSLIGFYPHFVRQREEQEQHGYVKRVAFMVALRAMVRRYFRLRINVHMGEEEALKDLLTPFLFVGNNRYQTIGHEIGTRSGLDGGRLWVCTAPRGDRENVLRVALRTLVGRATDQELNAFETAQISVEPETPRVEVSTDGEVSMMDGPLHYRIRPRALRVVVPKEDARPQNKNAT